MRYLIIVLLLCGCTGFTPWHEIQVINEQVNNEITYKLHSNKYRLPKDGKGNCTTYVYTKYIELKEIGVESTMAEVFNGRGKCHAVLLVDDYVLNSTTPKIKHKNKYNYAWRRYYDGEVWRTFVTNKVTKNPLGWEE